MTALADTLDTEPFPDTEQLGYQPRDMVLLGAGAAHVHLLRHLAKRPLIGATVTLVTPYPRHTAAKAAPNWVAGHTTLDDCTVALEPLVRRAGVRWLQRSVKALVEQVNLDPRRGIGHASSRRAARFHRRPVGRLATAGADQGAQQRQQQ